MAARETAVSPAQPEVGKVFLDREVSMAAQFVDNVDIKNAWTLSEIRDVLFRFESLRTGTLAVTAKRDANSRREIRRLLREIRTKAAVLTRLAAKKEARGELDDGGDVLPSGRGICIGIDKHRVTDQFRKDIMALCQALDRIRSLVLNGEDEQEAIYDVSGLLGNIRMQKAYALEHIAYAVANLVGEERRWVRKQLAGKDDAESRISALNTWITEIVSFTPSDPKLRESWLQEAQFLAQSTVPEEIPTLSRLRTSLFRLGFVKEKLSEQLASSNPFFRQKIQKVLSLTQEKVDALEALAAQREAAGEIDDGGDVPPSQRDNICTHPGDFDISAELREEVARICVSMDKIRAAVFAGLDEEHAVLEAAGRINVLKSMPVSLNVRVVTELECVLLEEIRWVDHHEAK